MGFEWSGDKISMYLWLMGLKAGIQIIRIVQGFVFYIYLFTYI